MSVKNVLSPLFTLTLVMVFQTYAIADSVHVSPKAGIYRAGGNIGNGGEDPSNYTFVNTPGLSFTFGVTGSANPCGFGCAFFGPDGNPAAAIGGTDAIGNLGGIIYHGTFSIPLLGVFLDDSLPASAPPLMDFYTSGSGFSTLSPQLGQVFWIGDGLTGTGSGASQTFYSPDGAKQLYFGVLDCDCYFDNLGGFDVDIQSQAPTGVAEPSSAILLLFAGGAMSLKLTPFRRRSRMVK